MGGNTSGKGSGEIWGTSAGNNFQELRLEMVPGIIVRRDLCLGIVPVVCVVWGGIFTLGDMLV